jgi:uncharacterized protein YbbK (DUF523 family)
VSGKPVCLVSACLLGVRCRYDGQHKSDALDRDLSGFTVIPVCPEQLGGLSTPRPAAEMTQGGGNEVFEGSARVLTRDDGLDVTAQFVRGAEDTLAIARKTGAETAFLKQRSPSCGCGQTWVDGEVVAADGVTTALLKRHGITVIPV